MSSVEAVNMLKYKAAGVEAELRGTSREVERDRLAREVDATLPAEVTPAVRWDAWKHRATQIILAHPFVYLKVHCRGMFEECFGMTRDSLRRLVYGRRVLNSQGEVTDESIKSARQSSILAGEELAVLASILVQASIWLLVLAGMILLVRRRHVAILLGILIPAVYVLIITGGPEGAPRFRILYQPFLHLCAALGVFAAFARARSGSDVLHAD
jgi:hypothetical protein